MKRRIEWEWNHFYRIEYQRHWWTPWFTLKTYPHVTESTTFDPGRRKHPKVYTFNEALCFCETLDEESLDLMLATEKAQFEQRYAAFKVRQAAWNAKGIYF
jgi:hypothetical protein